MNRSPHGLHPALRPRGLCAALRPLLREFEILYLRWALREMPLTHNDLPAVVVRLRFLLDQRAPEPMRAAWRWL